MRKSKRFENILQELNKYEMSEVYHYFAHIKYGRLFIIMDTSTLTWYSEISEDLRKEILDSYKNEGIEKVHNIVEDLEFTLIEDFDYFK